MTDTDIEREILAKGLTAARVTPADIEAEIVVEHYCSAAEGSLGARIGTANAAAGKWPDGRIISAPALEQVTICILITRNGTKLVGVNTGPISPANFDAELARKLARQAAVDQLRTMLGYQLRERLAAPPVVELRADHLTPAEQDKLLRAMRDAPVMSLIPVGADVEITTGAPLELTLQNFGTPGMVSQGNSLKPDAST